jgi:hypothetical protein
VSLKDLYTKYRDRVQFLHIYIREAHPKDGWWVGGPISRRIFGAGGPSEAAIDVNDPRTIKERQQVASRCVSTLRYEIPTYVDTMDDTVNKTYAAYPTRLYLIGVDGKVAYAGGLGPSGLKPEELKAAIDKYLT